MSRREVTDASAVLALLQREPGAENVSLDGAVMNSVNFAEVVQKSVARERPVDTLLQELTLRTKRDSFYAARGATSGGTVPTDEDARALAGRPRLPRDGPASGCRRGHGRPGVGRGASRRRGEEHPVSNLVRAPASSLLTSLSRANWRENLFEYARG